MHAYAPACIFPCIMLIHMQVRLQCACMHVRMHVLNGAFTLLNNDAFACCLRVKGLTAVPGY